jgi:hypothetical protein
MRSRFFGLFGLNMILETVYFYKNKMNSGKTLRQRSEVKSTNSFLVVINIFIQYLKFIYSLDFER